MKAHRARGGELASSALQPEERALESLTAWMRNKQEAHGLGCPTPLIPTAPTAATSEADMAVTEDAPNVRASSAHLDMARALGCPGGAGARPETTRFVRRRIILAPRHDMAQCAAPRLLRIRQASRVRRRFGLRGRGIISYHLVMIFPLLDAAGYVHLLLLVLRCLLSYLVLPRAGNGLLGDLLCLAIWPLGKVRTGSPVRQYLGTR